jgi:hypothetical protein
MTLLFTIGSWSKERENNFCLLSLFFLLLLLFLLRFLIIIFPPRFHRHPFVLPLLQYSVHICVLIVWKGHNSSSSLLKMMHCAVMIPVRLPFQCSEQRNSSVTRYTSTHSTVALRFLRLPYTTWNFCMQWILAAGRNTVRKGLIYEFICWSRDSSVGTVTVYAKDGRGFWVRFQRPDRRWVQSSLLSSGQTSFRRITFSDWPL